MSRERVQHQIGSLAAPWVSYQDCGPVAAPLEQVAVTSTSPWSVYCRPSSG